MTPIESELVLGFTRANGEQTISTVKGDTERYVHCTLVEDLLNYVVSDDVNYVVLKGVYSNGEIITPVILEPTYSQDRTEMTFKIDPSFTQISGVAKCVIVFLHCDGIPEFDDDGNLISFNANVLTSENFRLYIQADVLDGGCLSSADTIAVSSLIPLLIYVQEMIDELEPVEGNEQERIRNENQRIQNEAARQTAEAGRVTAENERKTAEEAREQLKVDMIALEEQVQELINDDYWAKMAKSWAVGDTGKREGEDTDNAKYYAEQAETSATSASSSASSALSSKNSAKADADSAYVSAQDAETAKDAAETAQNSAEAAQTASEAAKDISVDAKDDAVTAKNTAVEAATTATSAKDVAVSSKTAAETAATNAAASEAAAKTSEETAAGYLHSLDADVAAAKGYSEAAEDAKDDAVTAKTAAETAQTAAEAAKDAAEGYADAASDSADNAREAADGVEDWAKQAHSWANVQPTEDVYPERTDERTNNAWYWCKQAEIYAGKAGGGVTYIGSIVFESIPNDPDPGDQYNISNDFTTDNRFVEGAGIFVSAGTDIVFGANGKWNLSAPTGVASFKGRKGNITPQNGDYTAAMVGALPNVTGAAGQVIGFNNDGEAVAQNATKAMVGLGNVDNTSDVNKPISTATQEALDDKMDVITGTEGQLLGFDEHGDVVAMNAPETTPIATTSVAGKVKPDDDTIKVDANGTISVNPAATGSLVIHNGVICVDYDHLKTE